MVTVPSVERRRASRLTSPQLREMVILRTTKFEAADEPRLSAPPTPAPSRVTSPRVRPGSASTVRLLASAEVKLKFP